MLKGAWLAVVSFEDGERRPGAEKCGPSLAAGKVKERDSPLEPLEGNTALPIPWF